MAQCEGASHEGEREVPELCPGGYCRACHVEIGWDECASASPVARAKVLGPMEDLAQSLRKVAGRLR